MENLATAEEKDTTFYKNVQEFVTSSNDYVEEYLEAGKNKLISKIELLTPADVPDNIKTVWEDIFNEIQKSDVY